MLASNEHAEAFLTGAPDDAERERRDAELEKYQKEKLVGGAYMSSIDSRRRSGLPNATRKQALDTESK